MSKINYGFIGHGQVLQQQWRGSGKGRHRRRKESKEIVFVSSASIDELKSETAFALGCPAMGTRVLEEGEMEPFVCRAPKAAWQARQSVCSVRGWGDGGGCATG